MIRTIYAYTMAFLRTLYTVPGLIMLKLFFRKNVALCRAYAHREARNWARGLLYYAGVRLHVHGLEKVPKKGPVVFMGNHQGNFDIPVLAASVPLPIGFLAKDSLGKVPIMSPWMRFMGCVFVKRDNMRAAAQAALDSIEVLKSGHSMAVFPEGTRSKGGPMAPFKSGSVKIPSKAGVPIVPFTIDGSWKVMEANKGKIHRCVVHITFHDPVETAGKTAEELDAMPAQIQDTIKSGFVDFSKIDSYQTAPKLKPLFRKYLLLGSRWAVHTVFIDIIREYRPYAVKNIYTDELWTRSSHDILHRLEAVGARFDVRHMEKMRSFEGPAVFVANHMSTLETLILPGLINPSKPCTFVVKKRLTKGIVWGPIMRSRNPIAVTRKDVRADLDTVMEEGVKKLKEGRSIIIFPEGTRHDHFVREDFNSLGIKLAIRAGVPVVPVALKTDFWANSPILKGFGPIRRKKTVFFEFGDPIFPTGRGKTEHEQCIAFIEGKLNEWKALPGQS